MSLVVWLPLNGNLENQGLSDLKFSMVNRSGGLEVSTSGGKVVPGLYRRKTKETADYIVSNKNITLDGDVTMCCWAKVTGVGYAGTANGIFGQHGHLTGGLGITMKDVSSTDLRMSVNTGLYGDSGASDRTFNTYYGSTNIYNAWHHLCLTYNSSTRQLQMYVDGNLETITGYGNYITLAGNSTVARPIILFAWSTDHLTSNNYRPPCELNDVRIYDHCLSPQEVKEVAKGLRIHYQLNAARFENLLNRNEMYVYNNYAGSGTTGSIVDTGEKFMGEKVYRLTMTPNSSSVGSFQTEMGSHGIYTAGRTFAANTAYRYNVFYRPVSHTDVIVGGTASNIGGWVEAPARYWGDGWFQVGQYRVQGGSAQRDQIYTSFKTPSAAAGVPISIDFCCQSLCNTYDIVEELGVNEYYNLTETDVSGYGSHGSLSARVSNDPGAPKYQGGYWFSNQYLRVPTASYSAMQNSYTFSWWSSNADMNGKMAWGFEDGNRLNLYPSSWFNWNTGNGADNPFRDSNGNNLSFTSWNGGWHHYAITGNGSVTTLYIDGVARGTAKNYVGITGTKLLLSGWDTSGSYKWQGGLCDFRLYATCLSAEDVRDLCKTGAIITNDGTLMATEFSEFEPSTSAANFNKTGTVRALNFTNNIAQVSDMKMKALPDGSIWARIYKHDVRRTANWFNASQTQKIATGNRYSQMNLVDNFKASDGTYEFMWTQPEEEIYCPAGYTRLDCIEATGNQYINTGVYGYADGSYVRGHRWELDMEWKAAGIRQLMGYGPNGYEYWGVAANNTYEGMSVYAGKRHTIVHDYSGGTAGGNKLWVGNSYRDVGNNLATSQQYTFFGLGNSYHCKVKMYQAKCWKGKEKVRDFIPVRRNSDSCVGLYDLVTKKFYTSSGGPLLGYEIDKYIPIEYIESNGNQYIDTGIAWNKANSYKMTTKVVYTTTSPANQIMGFTGNRGCGIGSEYATWWECSSHPFAANTTYNLEWGLDGPSGDNYRTINGTTFSQSGGGAANWVGNMYLFAAHLTSSQASFQPSYHCHCKMYEAKIYVNNQLVRDFIPVYSTLNQRNGLYDKLNHKFYGTASKDNFYSGPFTCSEIESQYEFLEYIEGTGGVRIDTGIAPTASTEADIKFAPVGTMTENAILGSTWATNGYFLMFYQNRLRWHCRGAWLDMNTTTNKNIYYCHCAPTYITVNGIRYNNSGSTADTTNGLSLFNINGHGNNYGGNFRLYYCDIYDGSTLQGSFLPCRRKSDGAVGLYNCISGGFHVNQGGGSIVAGPRIYKEPIPRYNRWCQTNSPNTCAAATGVRFISSSWLNQFNGLVKFHNSGTCDYCCDTHNGTWYAPIGQRSVWEGGIPGAHGGMIKLTELWVRIDRLEAANNLSIVKSNTVACKNYMEI